MRWNNENKLNTGFDVWQRRCFGYQKFKTLKIILNIWSNRKLTLHGKVIAVNSLTTSGIWYLSNILELPEKYAK